MHFHDQCILLSYRFGQLNSSSDKCGAVSLQDGNASQISFPIKADKEFGQLHNIKRMVRVLEARNDFRSNC